MITERLKNIALTQEISDSSEDNPIINVVQKVYANDDIEIVIKKKYTTDYVKIMQRNGKKIINKKTERNGL